MEQEEWSGEKGPDRQAHKGFPVEIEQRGNREKLVPARSLLSRGRDWKFYRTIVRNRGRGRGKTETETERRKSFRGSKGV